MTPAAPLSPPPARDHAAGRRRDARPPVPEDIAAPAVSDNAQIVLQRRYLERARDGTILETPAQMLWRVAWHIAQAEAAHGGNVHETARAFYRMMARLEFLPASPTLMNAGRDLGQLSACFVLPIEDSLESIFTTLKHAALVHQSGGGTGFDFSRIRPQGDYVQTTHGVASGPLSFLRIYNATTDEIKQGGTRRGANMAILRVDHPDILDFIDAKRTPGALENFNVSVAITDDFMDALSRGAHYDLVHPRTGQTVRTQSARDVWHHIAEAAWTSGEPGLFFVDRANDHNPVRHAETIAATNPCSEQALAPYDSCNLGSIDLARHVHDGAIDWDLLKANIHLAVRFLDNVIDQQRFPVPEIEKKTLANRRIGLGIMGFARLLFRLGIPYHSDDGRATATQVMSFIQKEAHAASAKLAQDRGVFPNWPGSVWDKQGHKMRHAAVTTIAPTGTIGMIADTSGGCEPEFSLVYVKRVLDGTSLPYVVPELVATAKAEGFWSDDLLDQIVANRGSVQGLEQVPKKWQEVFATAHDIKPEDHVRMQAAFQQHVDNAVSKTINLPRTAKPDDVERAYQLAYDLGCRGITVYRDGSRPEQVLRLTGDQDPPTGSVPEDHACASCAPVPTEAVRDGSQLAALRARRSSAAPAARGTSGANERRPGSGKSATGAQAATHSDGRPRPPVTESRTHKIDTGCGSVYVTIGADDVGPIEVIAVRGRANACTSANLEATSRMATMALRRGIPLEEVAKALRGVRCGEPHIALHGIVLGCVDAIGQALERHALDPDGPQHEVYRYPPLDHYPGDASLTR